MSRENLDGGREVVVCSAKRTVEEYQGGEGHSTKTK